MKIPRRFNVNFQENFSINSFWFISPVLLPRLRLCQVFSSLSRSLFKLCCFWTVTLLPWPQWRIGRRNGWAKERKPTLTFFSTLLYPVVRSSSTRYLFDFVRMSRSFFLFLPISLRFRAGKVVRFGIELKSSYGYGRVMSHVCCLEWAPVLEWRWRV